MKKYLLFLIVIIFMSSCTDIIKMDLKEVEPKIVVEAVLDVSDSTCRVTISKTKSFYATSAFTKITDWRVELHDANNKTYLFAVDEEDNYYSKNIEADDGDIFTIKIIDNNGKVYQANATTPSGVVMADFMSFKIPYLVLFTNVMGQDMMYTDSLGNERKMLFGMAYWLDDNSQNNFYRIKIFNKGEFKTNRINIVDDKTAINDTMQIGLSDFFLEGDTVGFEFLTINKATYDYYYQLKEVLQSGSNSATPYNPQGNFDNDVLGYFCIQHSYKNDFIVKQFIFDE